MENLVPLLKEVGISGIIDILLMSCLIYTVLLWFKRTKAIFVLIGLIILGIVYLFAMQFELFLTQSVFRQFFTVILIVIVVIFQEELKRFFEQIAVWSLAERRFTRKKLISFSRKEIDILVRTVRDLSRENIGAIIVITGKDPIQRHLERFVELNGQLSEQILKSIFDPHSSGHDGALIIEGDKVSYFGCQLPLSKDFQKLQKKGTRHAAALGLAERTDAFCIVISEEKGSISIARNGEIQEINDLEKLSLLLERFYRDINPKSSTTSLINFIRKNSKEKFLALIMTIALWFVVVHESRIVYKDFIVPVQETDISEDFVLQEIKPSEVKITFSAPRRVFYFFNKEQVKLLLNIPYVNEGVKTIALSMSNLQYPEELSLIKIEPRYISIKIESKKTIKEREEKEEKIKEKKS